MKRKIVWVACLLVACTGSIGDPGASDRPPRPGDPNVPGDPDDPAAPVAVPLRCEAGDDRPGAARAWRLSATQFDRTMRRFLAGRRGGDLSRVDLPSVFSEIDPAARFSTRAASYTMTDLELRQLLEAASAVARATVAQAAADGVTCAGDGFEACVREELARRGPIALGRAWRDGELDALVALAADVRGTLGDEDALTLVYERLLASPETVFRLEIGNGRVEGSAARLDGFEIARALSYALTDGPPDDALWAAAEGGELDTDEGVAAQIDRLLALLERNAPSRRFLREYFGYDDAPNVFQEADANPGHAPDAMVADTERFVELVLQEAGDARFLETLLTADFAVARDSTQGLYGIEGLGRDATRVPLPDERRGILLQPAWLASFARTGETDPIHRGRFVSESLLCRPIPPIPIELDPLLPDLPGATMRERLEEHTQEPCVGCHQLMDPIGLSLEAFDHVGRFRTEELGRPVDVSGELTSAGSRSGELDGGRDLVERLAASEVVRECFVRHAFRYWLGRDEREGDGCALVAARDAYEAEGSYRDLVRGIFLSRAFLWRERGE
jgi:hypothetical protein